MGGIAGITEALRGGGPFTKVLAPLKRKGAALVDVGYIDGCAQPVVVGMVAEAQRGRGLTWIFVSDAHAQSRICGVLGQLFESVLLLPEAPAKSDGEAVSDGEVVAERLAVLRKVPELRKAKQGLVVAVMASLMESVPLAEEISRGEVRLKAGMRMDRDVLERKLDEAGFEKVSQVFERRQYAVRGSILDVFAVADSVPVRTDWFGDELESIRGFNVHSQMSVESFPEIGLVLGDEEAMRTTTLRECLRAEDLVIYADLGAAQGADVPEAFHGRFARVLRGLPAEATEMDGACFPADMADLHAGEFIVDQIKRDRLLGQLEEWRMRSWSVFLVCQNEGEMERMREIIPTGYSESLMFVEGEITGGFTCPGARVAVITDDEMLGRSKPIRVTRGAGQRFRDLLALGPMDFSEIQEGDLVVHLEYGIGRYEGLSEIPREGGGEEKVMVIEYAKRARVYVPMEQANQISKYVGLGRKNPPLNELGDGKWGRSKVRAERAAVEYAGRLLEIQAQRMSAVGIASPPDTHWQHEFEDSCPFEETQDQLRAIEAVKRDMESERPMDRLICGDVGFGKTEVALRAAFKAVMGRRQVAVLVPTTVLAEQHYRTFRERMSAFPIRVEMLSRYRNRGEQTETLKGLQDGSVDIVVGTHRVISKDTRFRDLGLVIVDEEQRFGVKHKEELKARFRLVDQLTLSATPIPRTLYLSLMGAREMSTLETPPANRIPVETEVRPYDERVIRDAIQREIQRGGQVYFLHNRVESIEWMRKRITELVPGARVITGHGQMADGELEDVMQRFITGSADVLVATTIIESGLDIPNANTIIIDRADRFGLADLYQLRGRVGRGGMKAYAYLMLPRDLIPAGDSRKRVAAMQQYSHLGAGFRIAMRDLEIRGAGNILGTQQSGHIVTVGLELYCTLLKRAIARTKGESNAADVGLAAYSFDFVALCEADYLSRDRRIVAGAFLPESYIQDPSQRIRAYRMLCSAGDAAEVERVLEGWRDFHGSQVPQAALNLAVIQRIRIKAAEKGLRHVEVQDERVKMKRRDGEFIQILGKFPRLNLFKTPEERLEILERMMESL
jgi:transcription-repair coupling factor (superfamily II helicase)